MRRTQRSHPPKNKKVIEQLGPETGGPPGPASGPLPNCLGSLGVWVRQGFDAIFDHEFMEVRIVAPKIPCTQGEE